MRLYVLVIGVVAAATALRWELRPLFGSGVAFITYYPAVAVAALAGGVRAGLVATVLSGLVADLCFFEPRGSLIAAGLGDWVALGLFGIAGTLISWMAERVEQARQREGEAAGLARGVEALRQSEERWRTIVESAPQCVKLLDREGRVLEMNPAGLELMQVTLDQIRNQEAAGLVAEEDRPAFREMIRAVFRGETRHLVFDMVGVKGRRLTLETVSVPLWEGPDKRQVKFLLGLTNDITERRRAEEALRREQELLRQSEEEFRAGFELSGVGKAQADPLTGRFLRVNAAYCRLTGYTEAELLSRTVADMTHPDDRERDWASYRQMGNGEAAGYEIEKRYIRRDGRVIWVHVCANMVRDAAGRPLRTVAVIQDITERKAFQAELERLVAERTAKLQEMVGELEHFSYTITHDLKAPLRTMRGFADMASLMCGTGVRKEAKDALGKISTAAERMDSLIADALNYSRSVRQELPLTDVDTGALLRGMLDSYPELQPSRAHVQVTSKLPVVLGNEAGLTQCFSNLLGNAVKFFRPGEKAQIRVWAEERNGWARIWVEDRGIGISRELLPRVFQMFSRGSKDYEGTGIGLALVRKVVQRMGGRVGVESEEGKGSRFWIELKLGEVRPVPMRVEAAPAEAKGGTVLYVEDEENDAMFMKMAFEKKGLGSALRVVGDGRAAIEYLSGAGKYTDRREYPLPSVVLLDLNLPQMPGFEVLRWMRNHPDFAHTPVVVFSSSTRGDDRERATELGANEFMAKPNSAMRFGEVVDRLQERWITQVQKAA